MIQKKETHIWHYLVTVIIFIGGLGLIYANSQNPTLQATFIIMTATFYFMWALVHHSIHHNFHVRTVIEYALVVTLGTVLAFYVIQL